MAKQTSSTGEPAALLIRADASTQIGTGHVMRCLALAQAWHRIMGGAGRSVGFATADCPLAVRARLEREGFAVHAIDAVPGSEADALALIELARVCGARRAVVDGYVFEPDYHARLRAAGLVVLAIDDLAEWERCEADLVLNQNTFAEPESYSLRAQHTALMLGSRFALLREEFAAWRKRGRASAARAQRLLVTMGGADPHNATARVLRVLAREGGLDFHTRVLIGPANPHREQLQQCAAAARAQLLGPVESIAEHLYWADLAISAAGSTTWELCCLGTPALTLTLAPNQEPIARDLQQRGVSIDLGTAEDFDEVELLETLELLRDDGPARTLMAARARLLVDGRGAERVARILGRAA